MTYSIITPAPSCISFAFAIAAQNMRLFLVWDSEGTSEVEDTIVEDMFRAVDEDSEDERPQRKKTKGIKRKKELTSSEADNGEDEGKSSGESQSSSGEKARRAFACAVYLISGSPSQQVCSDVLKQLKCWKTSYSYYITLALAYIQRVVRTNLPTLTTN